MRIIKKYKFYFITFAIVFLLHTFLSTHINDDNWFRNVINSFRDLPNFLINRYHTWTSRLFIESILVTILKLPSIVWYVLDSLILILLVYDIDKLFSKKSNKLLILILIGLYSFNNMSSAGWVATTLNYLWPLSLGLYAMIPIKKCLEREKSKWYQDVLYILSLLYACNQEQMCMIIFSVYLFFIIYLIKEKKINKLICISFALSIISLIFILTCPGNSLRNISETATWYPAFANFNIIDKAFLGVVLTTRFLLNKYDFIALLLFAIMPVYIFQTKQKTQYKLISIIPIIILIIEILISFNIKIPLIYRLFNTINVYSVLHTSIKLSLANVMALLLCFVLYGSIFINIYISFRKEKVMIIIYLLGLLSRIILGLSATIYASGMRPSIFLDFSFLIILYQYIQNLKINKILLYSILSIFMLLNLIFFCKAIV